MNAAFKVFIRVNASGSIKHDGVLGSRKENKVMKFQEYYMNKIKII